MNSSDFGNVNYINGLEDGFDLIKRVYELSEQDRKLMFGHTDVASIMDKYDIIDIQLKLQSGFVVSEYYVMRGIKDYGDKIKVVVESNKFKVVTARMLEHFLELNGNIDFADVKKIYVRELKG